MLLGIGALAIDRNLPLSPIDEHHHLDNVLKSGQLHIPLDNEKLGQLTMRIVSCTGIEADYVPPPCEDEVFDPLHFPDEGFNESAVSTPTFYVLTGLLARTLRVSGFVDDLLMSARLANWSWMALAGALVFHLLRRRSVPIVPAAALPVLMVTNPVALTAGVNVNPDAMLPLAGLLLFLVSFRRIRRPVDVVALAAAAVPLVTIDGGMIISLVLCLVGLGFVFIDSIVRHLRGTATHPITTLSEPLLRIMILLTAFLIGPSLINATRSALTGALGVRTVPLPRDGFFPRPDFGLGVFIPDLQSFPAIRGGYIIPPLRKLEFYLLTDLNVLLVASLVLVYAVTRSVRQDKIIGLTILGIGVFALPITNFLLWSRGGGFIPLSPRFVVSFLGVAFFAAGSALDRRTTQVLVTALAVPVLLVFFMSVRSH